ncbi:GNAT family N-acetyltransferase [[Clostridium] spiroforme]|nr:GNAT family N-acetyltransferase [Thomasclavelia spiroformis]
MELFISEAEIEDAAMIIDYLNQIGGESDFLQFGKNECYLNEFEEMEVIQNFIEEDNSLLLLGFIEDELVAMLSIQGERKPRLQHIGHFAITVKKAYWHMSIATMMMEEMLEMIKDTPLKILDLEVRSDNQNAIALYKKFNFQQIGIYPHMFYINDQFYDAICMNLYLK